MSRTVLQQTIGKTAVGSADIAHAFTGGVYAEYAQCFFQLVAGTTGVFPCFFFECQYRIGGNGHAGFIGRCLTDEYTPFHNECGGLCLGNFKLLCS